MLKCDSILTIFAHPDDAEIWAGGTILKHSDFSKTTILVGSTDTTRINEAKKGAEILQSSIIIKNELNISNCLKTIKNIQPEIIITHSNNDFHPKHREVSNIVQEAVILSVIETGLPLKLYFSDTYNSLTLSNRNPGRILIDVSDKWELKLESIKCHSSQPVEHFLKMVHRMGGYWGNIIGAEFAEVFDQVPILGRLTDYRFL